MGPNIYNINSDSKKLTIEMERVETFTDENNRDLTDVEKKEMLSLVTKLHEYDYFHGDLIKNNIGIKNGKLLF